MDLIGTEALLTRTRKLRRIRKRPEIKPLSVSLIFPENLPIKHFLNKDIHYSTGSYIVETNQYFPMRGNVEYSLSMIEYCLENNLIRHEDIKYTIQSM